MAKVKIPKRVAGMKIPKKVRRKAKKAVKMAESPVVRELAAAALGAAAEKAARRRSGSGVRAETVSVDVDRLAEAVRAAALDGLRRFLEGLEEGLREAAAADGEEAAAGGEASGRSAAAPAG